MFVSVATIQLKTLVRDVETDGYGGYFGSSSYGGNRSYFGNSGYDRNSGYNDYGRNEYTDYGRNTDYYGYDRNSGYYASSYHPYNADEYALYDVISAPIAVLAQEDTTMAQLAQEVWSRLEPVLKSRDMAETAFRRWMETCEEREREMKRLQEEELRRLGQAAKRREEERWGNHEPHRLWGTLSTQGVTQGVEFETNRESTQGVTQGVEKEGKETPSDLSSETPDEMEETPRETPRGTPQEEYKGLMGGDPSFPRDPLDDMWGKAPYLPLIRALHGDWRNSLVSCDDRRVTEAISAGSQLWLLAGTVETSPSLATTRRFYDSAVAQDAAVAQSWLEELRTRGKVSLQAMREWRSGGSATSLSACLDVFAQHGNLDESNKWFCPRCGKHVVARSVTRVDKLPSTLVLQLERFEYTQPGYGLSGGCECDGGDDESGLSGCDDECNNHNGCDGCCDDHNGCDHNGCDDCDGCNNHNNHNGCDNHTTHNDHHNTHNDCDNPIDCNGHTEQNKSTDPNHTHTRLVGGSASYGFSSYSYGGYGYGGRRKIQTLVEFPVRGLEMGPWLREKQSCVYDLTAVCNHSGSAAGGHYFCYARDENEGETKWFEYNDSGVYAMSEGNLVRETAYVLFYQRREGRMESGEVVREMERKHEEYLREHPLPPRDVFSANDSARAGSGYGVDGNASGVDGKMEVDDVKMAYDDVKMAYNDVEMIVDDDSSDDLYGDGMKKDLYDNGMKKDLYGDGMKKDLYGANANDHSYDVHVSTPYEATNYSHDTTTHSHKSATTSSHPINILFKDQSLTDKYLEGKRATANETSTNQPVNGESHQSPTDEPNIPL